MRLASSIESGKASSLTPTRLVNKIWLSPQPALESHPTYLCTWKKCASPSSYYQIAYFSCILKPNQPRPHLPNQSLSTHWTYPYLQSHCRPWAYQDSVQLKEVQARMQMVQSLVDTKVSFLGWRLESIGSNHITQQSNSHPAIAPSLCKPPIATHDQIDSTWDTACIRNMLINNSTSHYSTNLGLMPIIYDSHT